MSGARVRGRPAERSDGGCPERVWPAVSAPWVPDTGTGRLPRKRRTNFSTGFPRALRRKEVRAALSGGGQRRVPFAPATGAARSGPALTPLRCQRPAGKRQDVVDVERPGNPDLQLRAGPPAAPPIPRQRHRVSSRLCPRLPGSSRRQQHLPPWQRRLHLMVRCLRDFYLPWATPRRVYARPRRPRASAAFSFTA